MSSATLAAPPFASLSFDQKLDRLAEVAVRVGLNLQEGQELVLTAPTDALPLVRRIVEQAYKAGAKFVTTLISDDEIALARYRSAPDESFDFAPEWFYNGIANAFRNGAARMRITGAEPRAAHEPAKTRRRFRALNMTAMSKAYKPAMELITRHDINWTMGAP